MAVEIWCELVCPECAEVHSGQYVTGPRVPRKQLTKAAQADGWIREGDEMFCSQRCLQSALQRRRKGEEA